MSDIRNSKGQLEIVIEGWDGWNGWDGFDVLMEFMKAEYSAEVQLQADGPDARRCVFQAKGRKFELIHDDVFGIYLLAPTRKANPFLRELAEEINRRWPRVL